MELLIMHFCLLSSYFFLRKLKSLPQHSLLKRKKPFSNVKGQILHPQKIKENARIMYIFNLFIFVPALFS
jgi:hypothetical protein